jgi:hypothetical protein
LIGGAVAIGCAVILLAGPGMSRGQLHTGDTDHLVAGSRAILDCVDRQVFRACSFDASTGRSKVGPYPLLQYLPALAMRELGFRPLAVLRGLAWVNFVAFVVSIGLLASLAARARQDLWRPLLVVLGASGPMWFYATAGFGEMLAATMVLGAVLACLHRRPVLIGVLALLACLGKETFFPFVLALGLLAGRRDEVGWLPPRRVVLPLVLGVAGGAALSFGFNVFRYGTVRNVRYLQPQFRVHGVGRIASNVVELLIAPGGGLALYWPVIALLLIAAAVVGVRALRERSVRVFGPIAALFVVVAVYAVVLALWWAPFGWIAWGPRLFLPLIPALAVVAIHVGGGPLARLVSRALLIPVVFGAIVAVTLIGAFPEVSAPWSAVPTVATLREPDAVCPTFGSPGTDRYWRCFDHRAWRLTPNPLRTATDRSDAVTWVVRGAVLGGLVLMLLAAREAASDALSTDGYSMTATTSPEPTV